MQPVQLSGSMQSVTGALPVSGTMQPMQSTSPRELRKAVSHKRYDDDVCIALVKSCPDIDAGNANGKTALMLAAQFRPTAAVVEELLRCGASADSTTRRGHTALIFAAGRGRDATITTLLHAAPLMPHHSHPAALQPHGHGHGHGTWTWTWT